MLLLEGGDSIKKLKMWTIQFLPSIEANRRKLKLTVLFLAPFATETPLLILHVFTVDANAAKRLNTIANACSECCIDARAHKTVPFASSVSVLDLHVYI